MKQWYFKIIIFVLLDILSHFLKLLIKGIYDQSINETHPWDDFSYRYGGSYFVARGNTLYNSTWSDHQRFSHGLLFFYEQQCKTGA